MSWKKMKLGKFLEVRKGKFKPNDPAIADLKRVDKIDFSGQIHLSGKSSNTDMILIKKGDLLISGINVAKGAVTVYEGEEDIVATVHYSSYVYDADQIDITFLKLFLQSPEFFNAIREQIPGGIKTEIKPKHMLPLEVVIPSILTEQKELAALHFAFQAKQDLLDSELSQQLTHLTQLRQALLREAMQGQLLPQDPTDEPAALLLKKLQAAKVATGKGGKGKAGALFAEEVEAVEGPFEIPANWTWCKLEDVTTVIAGASFESSAFKEKGTKAVKITNVGVGCFVETDECLPNDFTESYSQFIIRKQDILIALTRPYIKDGLKVCVCPDSYDGSLLNQRVAAIKGFSSAVDRRYLYYYLSSRIVLDYIKAECGTVGQQPNLKMGTITGLLLPLPSLAEQHRIVAKLEQLMQHCDALEQRIRESRRLAEQLLQTALREALAPPIGPEEATEKITTEPGPSTHRRGAQLALTDLFE